MSSWDFKVWLKVEQIKALEREGKAGYLQHTRLVKEWEEMTGQKWGGEHGDQDNHPGKTGA